MVVFNHLLLHTESFRRFGLWPLEPNKLRS